MATKEQERSAFALKMLDEKFNSSISSEDANFLVGIPTMILQNGFGQSLAFLFSKAKGDVETKYYKTGLIIIKWANKNGADLSEDIKVALTKISGIESGVYLKIQQESLAMLGWLKRYARAFQKGD